jgi:hypothetical protein
MPVYAPDRELLASLAGYVREVHGGVVKRAATVLDLDYIMVRRFLRGGSAKPENRDRIRQALQTVKWKGARERKVADDVPLGLTRSVLMQLLRALDAYEPTEKAVDGAEL